MLQPEPVRLLPISYRGVKLGVAAKKPAKTAAKKSSTKKTSAEKTSAKGGRKYGLEASESVETEMHERKRGKLRSGSGQKVTNPKQAIAIGLFETRKSGAKVPAPKKAPSKKITAKKSSAE